jgi:glycosyltransferase involved in cell wall biosynthesis
MKLVIQVPAWNEEESLGKILDELPRKLPPFSEVLRLVVDDGSTDRTPDVAVSSADRLVRLPAHQGLAAAFQAGLDAALALGADVVVNFDADGQYEAGDIPALVAPILAGQADVVIGDRGPATLAHFSPVKRRLQKLGSWVVQQAAGIEVPDATSGFRALSRDAARRVNVFSKMTYTLETLIQAGSRGLRVTSVRVRANETRRRSRLFRSMGRYVLVQGANVLRITALYKPLKFFSAAAVPFLLAGLALGIRYLVFLLGPRPGGHVQSLILAAVLVLVGVLIFLLALLADLVSINRRLLEELKLRDREGGRREAGEVGAADRPISRSRET